MQSWGLDHVRLPVDYMLFEFDDAPGVYDEARLDYVDRTLRWCKQYGLNLILDLHHAPGFFFGNGDKTTFSPTAAAMSALSRFGRCLHAAIRRKAAT